MKARTFVQIAAVVGIAVCFLFLLTLPLRLPGQLGAGDFRAYWSASYLLAHGENFADSAQLFQVEQTQTQWQENWVFSTWNPPWLLAILIPYTWVSFDHAVWLWMLTSILLVFVCSMALWRLYALDATNKRWAFLMPLLAFIFLPTLLALIAGQVNVLVLAGLVGFLFFKSKRLDLMAGAALALTMVKPHLVYVSLAILLLDALTRRNWRVLVGFGAVLIWQSAVVLVLRPTFVFDYTASVSDGNLLAWQTATLGGALDALFGWYWSKLMGLVILPLSLVVWWPRRNAWDLYLLLDVTLLLSMIAAPFGWSYDFIVLIVPLLHMVIWVLNRELDPANSILLLVGLFFFIAAMYYQRTVMNNEVQFFWVPFVMGGLYLYAAWHVLQRNSTQTGVLSPSAAIKKTN